MPLNVVKVWYQNDWGLYGRRDERVAKWLARDERIGRVLHLEPPLVLSRLQSQLGETRYELNLATNVRRLEGFDQEGVHLFTPSIPHPELDGMEIQRLLGGQILERCRRLGILGGRYLLWLSAPAPLAVLVLELLGRDADRIVVELEDDHRAYHPQGSPQRRRLQAIYEQLVSSADIVLSVSAALAKEFAPLNPHIEQVPNAVDQEDFTRTLDEPPEISGLPHPRATYVGNLEMRIDWRAFEAVAANLTDGSVVAVGVPGARVRALAGRHANVHLIGPVPPSRVPEFLCWSDVLIMPHEVSEVTRGMDPQKMPEYLASGRPVVATPVAGTGDYLPWVRIEADSGRFARAVLEEVEADGESKRQARRERAFARTWPEVVAGMLEKTLNVDDAGERWRATRRRRYHSFDRPEVRAIVPQEARCVLDVGCGRGALGAALKRERGGEVWGIEIEAESAAEAERHLDRVLTGDVMELASTLPEGRFDAVILADVLEHVADPARLLRVLRRSLAPGGHVVMSVPNVRHWSVLRELLEGDFRYREAGILDIGHLRFFTRRSLLRLLDEAGLQVCDVRGHSWSHETAPVEVVAALRRSGMTLDGLEEEAGVHQYLILASCEKSIETSSRDDQPEAIMTSTSNNEADLTTLIVPVVDTCDVTREFLDSLRQHTRPGSWRLVIVDNGSTDGTCDFLSAQGDVTLVREPENRGFAAAVNRGLREAASSRVAIMNNDVLLTDGWLDRLVAHLESDPQIAFVAPSTNYAAGQQRVSIGSYETDDELQEQAKAFVERHRGQVEDVEFVVGLCLVARRVTLSTLGPFDERFGKGNYEDNDYCMRARRAGWRILVARDAFIHHHGNVTFRALGIDYARQMEQNRRIFDEKWRDDPLLIGTLAAQRRDLSKALEMFAQSLTRYPACVDPYLRTASCQIIAGDFQGAVRNIDRYLDRCPRSRDAQLMKAHALVAAGRGTDALVILEEIEREFYLPTENLRELKTTMASLHKVDGNPRETCRLLGEAFGISTPSEALGIELLEAAVATGDPAALVGVLERLIEVQPENLVFHLELAEAQRKAGNEQGARQAWTRALELDSGCEEARAALEPTGTVSRR